MARRKADAEVDLRVAHGLSTGLIEALKCPPEKEQVFLKDSLARGLYVRATRSGRKAFVFESRINSRTFRVTLGEPGAMSIADARIEAARLRVMVSEGKDPRAVERQQAEEAAKAQAAAEAAAALEESRQVTVGTLWQRYVVEGKPKRRDAWKPRYVRDMAVMTAPGGEAKKRGKGLTLPGHLTPLMEMRLSEISDDLLADWFATESKRSKHQAARALMMFRGFLRWCAMQRDLRGLVNKDAGKAPEILAAMPEVRRRTDALEAAQVRGWWTAVEQLPNRAASAYLRALMLSGARREEMARLKWSDVDFRWKKLTIADKVREARTIPMTDYMAAMLAGLPKAKDASGNPIPYVFASEAKTGRIADPRKSHERAQAEAGISGLTIHGLRRSFALLGEAAGAPDGAIRQVMGHAPSGVAEGYRPRSVDALRPYLQRIETHILELAGVATEAPIEGAKVALRVVA
jgi:integrase